MKITLISDTHAKHKQVTDDLPGGDLLIHAGDFMTSGYNPMEAMMFFQWFDSIDNYAAKIFIAGNHDRWMQDEPAEAKGILIGYETIDYLEDARLDLWDSEDQQLVIYEWAFNLPRNGEELKSKWDAIPINTDILVTHSPAWGTLDDVEGRRGDHLGCELLAKHINEVVKPKIHVCGHIHSGHGYYFNGQTHYFNASVLNERYNYTQKPLTFDWDPITNEVNWLW